MTGRAIGVFGGTFDPIHYGHLRTAYEVLAALQLSQVRFFPCGEPPHRAAPIGSPAQRRDLVAAAVEDEPRFALDERELHRIGPSYSVDTLASLRDEFDETPLALILGMDAFLGLLGWHRWHDLFELGHVVVAHRPGWKVPATGPLGDLVRERGTAQVGDLHSEAAGRIYVLAVTQLEIASTDIRAMIREGGDPRYLMPPRVQQLIEERGYYGPKGGCKDRIQQ